jgi:hypothetical protein
MFVTVFDSFIDTCLLSILAIVFFLLLSSFVVVLLCFFFFFRLDFCNTVEVMVAPLDLLIGLENYI